MSGAGMATENVVSIEPYVRYPRRLLQAQDQGELTYDQLSLAEFLCGAADYRTGTLTATITELKRRMRRTRQSDDKIRRDLHALKAGKWIDFDVEERQRTPWVIRLTGLLVREIEEAPAANSGASAAKSPPSLRQTTAANSLPQTRPSEHGERDSGAPELPQPDSSPSTSTALRSGEDELGWEDQEEGITFDDEQHLLPEVRAAIKRERQRRAAR
jgi:hypothetical protein